MSGDQKLYTGVHSDLLERLEQLNGIGVLLSKEKDNKKLLETILLAAKNLTNADGGTLYRMEETREGGQLRFEILVNDSLDIHIGGTSGRPIDFHPLPLRDENGDENRQMVAAYAALTGKTVNIHDAYQVEGFDFSGTRAFDKKMNYRSKSFLTVPMKDHEGELIGVLQLLNHKDSQTGDIGVFSETEQRFAESLASQAAIALTNRLLVEQLENLFESFIELINGAIDEKSIYTGGHCKRVPELTMMLADAVNDTKTGPLRDFQMTERDRYELRIAGLLHDCGKVTTPVHVVDKATKLETIYDRIHLVDTRFEILKRDAEIAMLKQAITPEQYKQNCEQYDKDRVFLRQMNIGGERMLDADIERIREIASYRWRDINGVESDFLSEDELKNLTIRAGTLTAEERQIINHHIDVTIRMLEALPWPKHLRCVPEYAGGHHERMDGKGYPRGLRREQMSVQARVMGIADIFEALTARDRPYKKGKTLSESLRIMGQFRLNGHIDPDLFDIFINQKVYLEYAQRYMSSDLIDHVDHNQIPGYQPIS